jgi:hypothetical protein
MNLRGKISHLADAMERPADKFEYQAGPPAQKLSYARNVTTTGYIRICCPIPLCSVV